MKKHYAYNRNCLKYCTQLSFEDKQFVKSKINVGYYSKEDNRKVRHENNEYMRSGRDYDAVPEPIAKKNACVTAYFRNIW